MVHSVRAVVSTVERVRSQPSTGLSKLNCARPFQRIYVSFLPYLARFRYREAPDG